MYKVRELEIEFNKETIITGVIWCNRNTNQIAASYNHKSQGTQDQATTATANTEATQKDTQAKAKAEDSQITKTNLKMTAMFINPV